MQFLPRCPTKRLIGVCQQVRCPSCLAPRRNPVTSPNRATLPNSPIISTPAFSCECAQRSTPARWIESASSQLQRFIRRPFLSDKTTPPSHLRSDGTLQQVREAAQISGKRRVRGGNELFHTVEEIRLQYASIDQLLENQCIHGSLGRSKVDQIGIR
jgi:hypothetical protein